VPLVVSADALFVNQRVQLVVLAARHAVPAIYAFPESTAAGGLMSYGPNLAYLYQQAGAYAGRILKGAKSTDLPVQQAVKLELVINLQDRQGVWHHRPTANAHPRRRGDRITTFFAAPHMSAFGTKQTLRE